MLQTHYLFDSDGNLKSEDVEVDLVISANGPEDVAHDGHPLEVQSQVGQLNPSRTVLAQVEDPAGGVNAEQNLAGHEHGRRIKSVRSPLASPPSVSGSVIGIS